MSDLDKRLRQAHEAEDKIALAALYQEAADATQDQDAAGFFLTHAYIFALDANAPSVDTLRNRLIAMGREVPQG